MTEEHFPAAPHAPFSIVAISALLWSQGGIWAALGVVSLYLPARVPAGGLITAVLFGFAALSWVLDGYYLMAPVGLFVAAGIFMSVCAAASLLSGSARDYCHQRAAL